MIVPYHFRIFGASFIPMRSALILLALFIASVSLSQLSLDPVVFDSILGKPSDEKVPGYGVMIIHKGDIVYSRYEGYANIRKKSPINSNTVFDVASLAKQFTATAILLLEAEGKLSLDDRITQYLPELPKIRTAITINHLLGHSSGIRSYLALLELQNKLRSKYLTEEQFWTDLKKQNQLSFYPGDAFAYNNTGYVLLAEIVEKVSGQSFQEFTRKNIFEPLGMSDTRFQGEEKNSPQTTSYRWDKEKRKSKKTHNPKYTVGDGSLYTTLNDLYKWDQNFYRNVLGKGDRTFFDKMQQSYRLNDGRKSFYGMGVNVKDFGGYKLVEHSGNWDHFYSQYSRFPEYELSVIVCSNSNKTDARNVAEQLITSIYREVPRLGSSIRVEENEVPLAAFEGTYLDMHTKSSVRKIVAAGNELYYIITTPDGPIDYKLQHPGKLNRSKIQFLSEQGGKIIFSLDAQGQPQRYSWENSPQVYTKLTSQSIFQEADSLMLGKYYSEELDRKVKVKATIEDDELKLKINPFVSRKMIRLDQNFFWIPKKNIVFEFTEENLFIHTDRASNIRFEKVK